MAGASVIENTTDVSSYSYDSSKQELVSYDTPDIAKLKAQYVEAQGLAGSMFWDVSGSLLSSYECAMAHIRPQLSTDKTGDDSLVGTTANVYGSLDQTQNHISYPDSKWDNIKNNMGQGTGGGSTTTGSGSTSTSSTPTSTSSTSVTTTSTSATTTPTSGSGACSGVAAWNSQSVYVGGQSATYSTSFVVSLCGHMDTANQPDRRPPLDRLVVD